MGVMAKYSGFGKVVGIAVHSLFTDDRTTVPKRHGARPIVLIHGFAAHSRVLLPLECYLRRTLKRPIVRVALGQPGRDLHRHALPKQVGDQNRQDALCDAIEGAQGESVTCPDLGRNVSSADVSGPVIPYVYAGLVSCHDVRSWYGAH